MAPRQRSTTTGDAPSKNGDARAQRRGWLEDRYVVALVPARLLELLKDHNSDSARRAMQAMLCMQKINIKDLERVTVA